MASATKWTPPGARRRQITIQQAGAATKTAAGFTVLGTTPTTVQAVTWACITPRAMPTALSTAGAGDQPIVRMFYVVNIRYIPGVAILPGMRVVELDPASKSATYVVQTVVDVEERHRELNLYCAQVPASAALNQ